MADEKNTEGKKHIIRVSVSEAARLFGVNAQTIRRALLAGDLSYIVVAGRYKVNFESLVTWSQKTTIQAKTTKRGIGQFVERWNIAGKLYSPSVNIVPQDQKEIPLDIPDEPHV
ncbi:hypothetical protein A3H75_01430 [Candidatus Uhrbacteria bacterium RIFCSPLOWO2_02_FULL_51_9]|uniref:Helix-turn-helix domain-containing protein n=1 Tax=Candidatus Uhrbacteria bacterium RIFCSPLOWO2_02_FULL_51_9 TaxID=1802410 RepID=A0A1F7VGE1_9BACT|nr:MAG: hypothetical protein A3H75_01430 [Candidatus Uhrbacteria bacterium RIFCSPLOWO2_02_FULL_51_9]